LDAREMTRSYRYVHVDVFTRQRFGGNQLAVFPQADGLTDAEMQDIARELNFSETTFVFPPGIGSAPAEAVPTRIFTPGRELPFAGHPVVGTGYVLGSLRGQAALRLQLPVETSRSPLRPTTMPPE
jgi:trans-2,3-dihydro-3-hydroxyanthranilate isomerase